MNLNGGERSVFDSVLHFFWLFVVEFTKVAVRTAIGFVVMGFVGFFVKLIFIPINNIIVGAT